MRANRVLRFMLLVVLLACGAWLVSDTVTARQDACEYDPGQGVCIDNFCDPQGVCVDVGDECLCQLMSR